MPLDLRCYVTPLHSLAFARLGKAPQKLSSSAIERLKVLHRFQPEQYYSARQIQRQRTHSKNLSLLENVQMKYLNTKNPPNHCGSEIERQRTQQISKNVTNCPDEISQYPRLSLYVLCHKFSTQPAPCTHVTDVLSVSGSANKINLK